MTDQYQALALATARLVQEQHAPSHMRRRDTLSDLENDLDEALKPFETLRTHEGRSE